MEDCECRKADIIVYVAIGIILGIVAGVTFGVLFANGLIPVTLNFIKIALIMSVVVLFILLASILGANIIRGYNSFYNCICKYGIFVLVGTIGTLLAATITAIAGLVTKAIISITFVSLTAFFFVIMIFSAICLLSCLIRNTCSKCIS